MRGEAFRSRQSSQAGHRARSAALALQESFAYESFAYGSFMHLSPTEVKRQLVSVALCPLGVFVQHKVCVTLFRITDDFTSLNEHGSGGLMILLNRSWVHHLGVADIFVKPSPHE